MLSTLARELGPMVEEVVFVGGHVPELLIDSRGTTRVRPTIDIDVVVSATTRVEYADVEERLRDLGFRHDSGEGAPLCRWLSPSDIVLDVMPVHESVLGFTNPWYPTAIETSMEFELAEDLIVRIPRAALFLAMKWAAVEGRAGGDVMGSHDMEDIVAVVTGRTSILREVGEAPEDVREWLSEKAGEFLRNPDAEYALEGSLPDSALLPDLVPSVRERFERMRDRVFE